MGAYYSSDNSPTNSEESNDYSDEDSEVNLDQYFDRWAGCNCKGDKLSCKQLFDIVKEY